MGARHSAGSAGSKISTGRVANCEPLSYYGPEVKIGMRLKRLRAMRKMSRYELAKRAGISRVHVKRLEEGEQDPTLGTLQRLAKALEVTVDTLLTDPFEKLRRLKTADVLLEAARGGRTGPWFEGVLSDWPDPHIASATQALTRAGLIAKTKDGRTYRATDRGRQFLRRHRLEAPDWIIRAPMIRFP